MKEIKNISIGEIGGEINNKIAIEEIIIKNINIKIGTTHFFEFFIL